MSKPDRNKEREVKNAEREMPVPDMGDVISGEQVSQAEMAQKLDMGFEGFSTIPDGIAVEEPNEPEITEDLIGSALLDELIEQMQLANDEDDQDHADQNDGDQPVYPAPYEEKDAMTQKQQTQPYHTEGEEPRGSMATALDDKAISLADSAEDIHGRLRAGLGTRTSLQIIQDRKDLEEKIEEDAQTLVQAREYLALRDRGYALDPKELAGAEEVVAKMSELNPYAIPMADALYEDSAVIRDLREQDAEQETKQAETYRSQADRMGKETTTHLVNVLDERASGTFIQAVWETPQQRGRDANTPLAVVKATHDPKTGNIIMRLVEITQNAPAHLQDLVGEVFVINKRPQAGFYLREHPNDQANDRWDFLRMKMQNSAYGAHERAKENAARLAERETNKLKWDDHRADSRPLFEVMAGETGHSVIYAKDCRSGKQAGNLQMAIRGDGQRIYLSDWQTPFTPRGKEELDLSGFPQNGIPMESEDGERGIARFVRRLLEEVRVKQCAYHFLEEIEAANSVLDLTEGKRGKAKGIMPNWTERKDPTATPRVGPIALAVNGTGKNLKLVEVHSPVFTLPEAGASVPCALQDDPEDAEDVARLKQVLRQMANRDRKNREKASDEEAKPDESETEPQEAPANAG